MMALRTKPSTAHRVIAACIRSHRGRRAAPGAVPGGAWAYRRKTAAGRARLAGAAGFGRASVAGGIPHHNEVGERRVGGGWFWAGSFIVNASQATSPRARSPATDVSEQASAGPEQARVMGSVNFYVQSSLVRSVTGVFHEKGDGCGRAGPAAVGKPSLREGSLWISRRARSVGTGSDPSGTVRGRFEDDSGTIRGRFEGVLAGEARSDQAGGPGEAGEPAHLGGGKTAAP